MLHRPVSHWNTIFLPSRVRMAHSPWVSYFTMNPSSSRWGIENKVVILCLLIYMSNFPNNKPFVVFVVTPVLQLPLKAILTRQMLVCIDSTKEVWYVA